MSWAVGTLQLVSHGPWLIEDMYRNVACGGAPPRTANQQPRGPSKPQRRLQRSLWAPSLLAILMVTIHAIPSLTSQHLCA